MPLTLSQRSADQPASPIRRLAPFAAKAAARGISVFHLNIGQPDIDAPPEVLDRLKTFDGNNVAYGPSQGLPEFIDSIHDYYQRWDLNFAKEMPLMPHARYTSAPSGQL